MDQNFSLMAQSRANYYTAGSPVQFVRVELLKGDTTGEVAVCLTFKNVGTEPLTGLVVHFKCKDAAGQVLCEDDFYYEQLNAQPGAVFGSDDAVYVSDTPVSSVEVEQDRAFLNGRGVDLRNYKRVRLNMPRVLPGSIAKTLQQRTGNVQLTCVPQDTEYGWFCACGAFHPNEENTTVCSECGGDRAGIRCRNARMAERESQRIRRGNSRMTESDREEQKMKVVKFGGSSMADAGQYRKVRDILLADPERRVVVVSAAGKRFGNDHKLTDLLYLCYAHVQYGVDCSSIFDMIASRYLDIRDELGLDLALEPELDALKKRIDAKEVTQEELVSRGEYFSAKLMAAYLGFQFVDAADWVMFNMDGTVNREVSYKALRNQVLLGYGAVIPGFYGAMPDGAIHTFSRGGSDITGALAAAALDADVYENWTDVSGILMADPRIVDDPQAIPEVTYDELRELSYSGAQVLHEDSIFPVREKNIPVNIRNTNDPEAPGTMIQESFSGDVDPDRFITGITGKKDFSIISLTKRGMSNQVGVLRRVLSVLERHNISVDYVSVVLPTAAVEKELYTIMAEIKKEAQPDTLDVHHHIAVVAAVGRKMAFRPGISGRIFKALGESGINIRMINQGPDELNIIFGVDNKDFKEAIRVLYNSFVK